MQKSGIIVVFCLIFFNIIHPCVTYGIESKDISRFSLIDRTDDRVLPPLEEKKIVDFNTFLESFRPLTFNQKIWTKVAVSKEKVSETKISPIYKEGIGFELPYESSLTIYGQKEIQIKYEKTIYDNEEKDRTETPKTPGGGIDIEQKLQAMIKGKVGRKITVNVDYDDTKLDQRDISVVYKGDPEEVVQEAAFGDIELSLPSTEFVSYNKKLFGAKIDTKYKGLRFMAIGSRIKGISDYKEFRGITTFKKKDVYDISYVKRKYYKLYFNIAHLPIANGSELIYIDDQDVSNNTTIDTTRMTVYDYSISTTTYTGDFDLQKPGEDYTIDYNEGIITFSKNINQNYVIAVAYKYSGGEVGYSNDYRMIKNETESIDYSLKNYYNFGDTKILSKGLLIKIQDLNRNITTEKILYENETDISQAPYEIDILDFDSGILKFKDETPFPDDVYKTIPTHHYFIYVEYRNTENNYRLGRIDIIKGSEQVRVDGKLLNRDVDYLIDYDIGLIVFLKDDIVKEDSNIRIDFEYMPFGGQLQQTLVGARGELNINKDWFIGSSCLYNFSSNPSYVPDVKSAPESILVLEADTKYKFTPEGFPVKAEISGEIANSQRNINTYGKAMIDSMEGIKIEDTMPTNKKLWLPSSNPSQSVDKRQHLEPDNEDVKVKDINPNIKLESLRETEQQVLVLRYNLPEADSWSSICYPISKTRIDYSKRKFLELQLYGDGGGGDLHIDLGRINEDINNNGTLDTEDINENNELDIGEDVGMDLSRDRYGNSTNLPSNYGADNGRLDTEDLDGDGALDGEGFISSYASFTDIDGVPHTSVDWTGWKSFRIPLDITPTNQGEWENIKHIRIWLKKGTSTTGTLKIASVNIVGNKWEDGIVTGTGSLVVRAVNNEDDADYEPLINNSDYKDIYTKTGQEKDEDDREQALSLEYDLAGGEEGYTKRLFSTAQDYRDYKQLKFFVYGNNAKRATFYFRIGTPSAYFQFEKEVDWIGWRLITLQLVDLNSDYLADEINSDDGTITKSGNPSLNNITEITLGVVNNTGAAIDDGELWVNEIHLSEAQYRKGWAKRVQLSTSYKDWASLIANFKTRDRNFESIGVKSVGQESTSYSLDPKITYLKYLPITGHWDKTETITPTTIGTDLSSGAEGTVISENKSLQTNFNYKKLPTLNTKVSQSLKDAELQQRKDRIDTFSGSGGYDIPTKFFIFPKGIRAGYARTNAYINYNKPEITPGYESSIETLDDWSGEIDFSHSWGRKKTDIFNLTPSYKIKRAELEKELPQKVRNPKYTEQNLSLRTNLRLFSWFSPQANGNVISRADYNTNPSSYTVISKNIKRDSSIDTRIPFAAKNLVPKSRVVKSLEITPEYRIERRDSYENVRSDFYMLNKLWVDDRLNIEQSPKTIYTKDDFRTNMYWKPLEFLELKRRLRPIGTMGTRVKYNIIKEHRETTGTPLDTDTTVWPDLEFNFSDVEYLPPFYKFMDLSRVNIGYYKKEINKRKISLSVSETWNFKWDFRLWKRYTWILKYQDILSKEENPDGVHIRTNISQTAGIQVNFTMWKNLRFKVVYDDKQSKQKGDSASFTHTKAPGVTVETDLRFPRGLHLPLIKNPIQLKNAIKLSTNLQAAMERGSVARNNKDTYTGNLQGDYDLSANFMFSLGAGISRIRYIEVPLSKNSYWTYNILFKLLIKF